MNSSTTTRRRILTSFVALVMLTTGAFGALPARTHAFWGVADIVYDPVNWIENALAAFFDSEMSIKEFILDPLVNMAGRAAIQSIMRSVINWANSGFEGSPAFVDDLQRNMRGLADLISEEFIDELGISGYIDTPFRDIVMRELRTSYRRATADAAFFELNRYTLDRYSDDPQRFLRGDFSRGGIRAWIQTWVNPQNNPGGALGQARTELENRVSRALSERSIELGWSRGVLSWCGDAPPREEGAPTDLTPSNTGCEPGQQRLTMGSSIHNRIEKVLGADIDMMVSADEIDEMIGAVLQGLINKMLGGGGFAGLSESSGGGRSAVDEATGESGTLNPGTSGGAIDGQIEQLERHKLAWEAIFAATQAADAKCDVDGDQELIDEVNAAMTEAQAEVQKATELLEELRVAQFKLASENPTVASQGQQEFDQIMRSGRLPTVTEIRETLQNSQNLQGLEPPTTVTRMTQIEEDDCKEEDESS